METMGCRSRPARRPLLDSSRLDLGRDRAESTSIDLTVAGMCFGVLREQARRSRGYAPRAPEERCLEYYGVDYFEDRGKLVCRFTAHSGTKTLRAQSAPADRRSSRASKAFDRATRTKRPLVPRDGARSSLPGL